MRAVFVLVYFLVFSTAALANIENQCEFFNRYSDQIQSGYINVPEFEGSNNLIKVAYFYRPGQPSAENYDPTPVLFFNGGPSLESHYSLREMLSKPDLNHMPLVFMDQRGTGCSTPYPELTAETINRSHHWGSRAIVRDAEALRKKLFPGKKWKLFGHSYGGLISYRYLSMYPEAIAAITVYGYSPTKDPIDWLYNQTVFIGEQTKAYLEEYPGDVQLVQQVRKLMTPGTCLSVRDYELCGDAIIDVLGKFLAFQSQWDTINHNLIQLKKSWGTRFEEQQMGSLAKYAFRDLVAPTANMANAISNYEIVPGYTPHEAYRAVEERLRENDISTESWLFNPVKYMKHLKLGDRELMFKGLRADPLSVEEIESSLRKYPEIVVNVFSGERDGILPPENYLDIYDEMADLIYYVKLPGASHNDYLHRDITQAVTTSSYFDFTKCSSLDDAEAMEVISSEMLPWIAQKTTYKTKEDAIGLPKVCKLSQREMNFEATGDYERLGPPIKAYFLINIHESSGVILINEDVDLNSIEGRDQLVHELIHFVQYKNGMFSKYKCLAESEKEAYLLSGDYLKTLGVDAFTDPLPLRHRYAYLRSQCP